MPTMTPCQDHAHGHLQGIRYDKHDAPMDSDVQERNTDRDGQPHKTRTPRNKARTRIYRKIWKTIREQYRNISMICQPCAIFHNIRAT